MDAARLTVREALDLLPVASLRRDPFALRQIAETASAPIAESIAPPAVDTVHLTALWTQDGVTLMLINDRICQAGDEIGRLKIESATQDGVWLSHWNGRSFLALGDAFTLTTPARSATVAVSSL